MSLRRKCRCRWCRWRRCRWSERSPHCPVRAYRCRFQRWGRCHFDLGSKIPSFTGPLVPGIQSLHQGVQLWIIKSPQSTATYTASEDKTSQWKPNHCSDTTLRSLHSALNSGKTSAQCTNDLYALPQ